MPLFICDCCGAVDNTACGGNFWYKGGLDKEEREKTPDLCCKCHTGEWHNKFPYEVCTAKVFNEIGESNFVYWMMNCEPKSGPVLPRPHAKQYTPKINHPKSKNHMKKLARGMKKKRRGKRK